MKKAIILCLLITPVLLSGQAPTFHLQWNDTDSLPGFSGASYPEAPSVPYFFYSVPWEQAEMRPRVKLVPESTSPVPAGHLSILSGLSLQAEPQLISEIVYEKKRPMLQCMVLPFFTNPRNGRPERLESFTLEVSLAKPMAGLKSLKKGTFAANSVLANHDWYRIETTGTGIYRLTYEQLQEIGLQNPAAARIFGAGAILLPEDFSKGSYDDLEPVPVYMEKGSDQIFGPGDYLLFYARGPVSWTYDPSEEFWSQHLHDYATAGAYFVTDGMGMATAPPEADLSGEAPTHTVTTYDLLDYHEEENFNLLKSGKEWYADRYSITLSRAYPFSLSGLHAPDSVRIRVTAAARSNETSTFSVSANNKALGSVALGTVNLSSYTSTFAVEESRTFSYKAGQEVVTVNLTYSRPNDNSEGWLNHITINARGNLSLDGDQLRFRDSRSAGFGNTGRFRLQGAGSNTLIWDVSDPGQPLNVGFSLNGSTAEFVTGTDEIREFVAFRTDGDFPSPDYREPSLGKVPNQNLHGTAAPDLLIVYAERFTEQASRLADHRRSHDGLEVLTVTQEMIFNEFSSGTPNISALRNFLKMYYDSGSPGNMPRYLLLFGDGSFDNRDTASHNPNLILSYQSDNSLSPTRSFVSDDFYGLLDTGESLTSGLLDIGIGRLPASTVEEAENLVDKLIAYSDPSTIGEWRNYITFIGDDEDNNIHMRQADDLAVFVEENYPAYNVNRIFMDAYPQETSSTGDSYPDVTRAINEQMQQGALIMNYTGHGGVTGLAHEKILDKNNIKSWRNDGKWPLFMTATCEFSRYDEYNHAEKVEVTSAGEEVLLNPVGGSIALFTTTRLVYSGPNHELNEEFYRIVFERDENNECLRLGDIIAYSKNQAGAGINKRNFTLLGDPSTVLAFPGNRIVTDSINSKDVVLFSDTISALDFVTVTGHVQDQQGNLMSNFNGTVTPIVYDKKNNLETLGNDGGSTWEFQARNSILYKGTATVTGGRFSFSFYIPKDISYVTGYGKISYYGNNTVTDAHGSEERIIIGGIGNEFANDTTGPVIRVFMNDSLFRNGGIVNNSPELLVYIRDEYGINTTGNGIGHDITATLNGDRYNAIILNSFYQSDIDSYNSGTIRYPYSDLPEGKHTVAVKVWDIYNNSARESIDFVVVESFDILLEKVYNYPNPFTDQTWFNIEHNRPDQEFEVLIRIYDLRGQLVTVLKNNVYSPGFRIDPVGWNGTGFGGATLGGGIYVYQVVVRSESGEQATDSGRLIIKR